MKPGSRRWRSAAWWLGMAAVLALGAAGSRAPLSPAAWVMDARAQTTPEGETKGEATAGATKPGAPKGDKPRPQTATEADEALVRLMAERRPVRGATARGQTIADAPRFTVTPRLDRIRDYPCTKCHDNQFVDGRVRELQDEHTKLVFEHGGGRFWCYDACHRGTDMDNLVSLRGRPVGYDESYKLCGQCHFQRLDWYFGGHGKRQGAWEDQREIPKVADELRIEDRDQIARWTGERTILNCTECHDPHSPAIKPFEPSPPPRVRSGLRQPVAKPAPAPKIWERLAAPGGRR